MTESKEIMAKKTIERLTDFMYEGGTRNFFLCKFAFYLFGFYFPMVYNVFDPCGPLEIPFIVIMSFQQILLVGVEVSQVMSEGITVYVQSFWNAIDCLHLVFFILTMLLDFTKGCHSKQGPYEDDHFNIVLVSAQNLLMVVGFFKIMYFLRVFPQLSLLLQMTFECFTAISYFVMFFFMWVSVFSLLLVNLKAEIIGDSAEDYEGLP